MAEETNKKDLYTWENSSESIFKDFEPYHCGIPAITDAFFDFEFDPEKCNETNNFQKFERNGYTNEITTSKTVDGINYHYSANGQVISGCEKGTVILADHPERDTFICQGNNSVNIWVSTNETNGTKVKVLNVGDKAFSSFNNKVFPKRLGILLVGGGGGAGGGSWYDAKKDGKNDDTVYCSGGSGGGGGIIWGVIDLEELCKKDEDGNPKPISIAVGRGGEGGRNATTSGLTHNKPKKGENGNPGHSTILYNGKYSGEKIAVANGGGGGAAGHWTDTASGGDGGGSSYNAEYFTYCGKIDGAPGITTKKDMDDEYTQERLNKIQFLQDNSNDKRFTYKTENIPARKSYVTVDTSARIPGGPSFGTGAHLGYLGNINDYIGAEKCDIVADKGGGGCSNGANGSNNGARGYWMIFYA